MNNNLEFCVYITPCGYCSKFDKWCEKKYRGKRVKINPIDDSSEVINKIKSGMGLDPIK